MEDRGFQRANLWRDVQFSEESVSHLHGHKRTISIPRAAISRMTLRHGRTAQWPLLQLVSGIILVLGSMVIAWRVLDWINRGILFSGMVYVLAPAIVGVILMFRSLVSGFYLDVQCDGVSRKLPFRGKPKVDDIERFLKSVESSLGYTIERGAATKGFPIAPARNG